MARINYQHALAKAQSYQARVEAQQRRLDQALAARDAFLVDKIGAMLRGLRAQRERWFAEVLEGQSVIESLHD